MNAELSLFGLTHAALFVLASRALFRQPGFLCGTQPLFLFLAPPLCCGLRPPSRVFSCAKPRLFFGRYARLLKGVQLHELVRE